MVRIKPHHFVDILRTLGANGQTKFQPHAYGHDFHVVAKEIVRHPELHLQIELGIDDICQPCRHHVAGDCDDTIDTSFRPDAPESKQAWNLLIDRRWCQALDLAWGDQLTASEMCRRIVDRETLIFQIYCELPAQRIDQRRKELLRGAEIFLDGSARSQRIPRD